MTCIEKLDFSTTYFTLLKVPQRYSGRLAWIADTHFIKQNTSLPIQQLETKCFMT